MTTEPQPLRIRWGIIGAGNIARHAIAPAILESANGFLYAVASRGKERAEAIAQELGVSIACGSYEELLQLPEVDAVYIGLPNGLHEEWAIKAAQAGKHVLCEKSLAMTSSAAHRMRDEFQAHGVLLMEAFMYRHHPQWVRVHEILCSGEIGEIKSITAHLGGTLNNVQDHRWSAELGGGALFDVTCYGINAARYLLNAEPTRVQAIASLRVPGVDESSHVLMEFPGGVLASAQGTLSGHHAQGVRVVGTNGVLDIERPFVCNPEPTRLWLTQEGKPKEEILIAGANQFKHEVEHFAECILSGNALKFPAEDGVANTVVCEKVARKRFSQA